MRKPTALAGVATLATTMALLVSSTGGAAVPFDDTQAVTTTRQFNGTTAPKPLVGDFDGDLRDDVLWYVPGTSLDILWSGKARDDSTLATSADRFSAMGLTQTATYRPIVGDFDGDDRSDILWYAPGPAPDAIWYFTGRGTYVKKSVSISSQYTPVVGDFDSASESDIAEQDDIFLYSASGTSRLWIGNQNRTFTSVTPVSQPPLGAKVYAGNWRQSDLTAGAEVFLDLLFYVPGTGDDEIWVGNGLGTFASSDVTINGNYNLSIGDFDRSTGPAMTDIFWYAPGTASDYLWVNMGQTFSSIPQSVNGTSYKPLVVPAADPLKADTIVWNNTAGADYLWQMTGTDGQLSHMSFSPGDFGAADVGARSPLVGDFDLPDSQIVLSSSPRIASGLAGSTDVLWWAAGSDEGQSEIMWQAVENYAD